MTGITKVDLSHSGLRMFLSQPAEDALDYLWDVSAYDKWPRRVREIHEAIGEKNEMSRTSVNNLLKNMANIGLIDVEEILGPGGMKRRYWPVYKDKKRMIEALTRSAMALINKGLKEAEVDYRIGSVEM